MTRNKDPKNEPVLVVVSKHCNDLQLALEALDRQAEAAIKELETLVVVKLDDLLLPRAAYTPGMYARDVYQVLRRMLG